MSKKINCIYLTNSIGSKEDGGASISGLRFANLLIDEFGEVEIYTDQLKKINIDEEKYKIRKILPSIYKPKSLRGYIKIVLIFVLSIFIGKKIKYDAKGLTTLVFINSFTDLYEKIIIRNSPRIIKICVVRGDTTSFAFQSWGNEGNTIDKPKEFLLSCSYLIYVSKTIRKNWEDVGVNIKSSYLPNSINEEEVNKLLLENINILKEKVNFSNDKFNIVIAGTLQERKGQDIFASILNEIHKRAPKIIFHFIGGISAAYGGKEIANTLLEKSKNNVVIHGHKNDVLNYVAAADMVISVSRSEAFPRVIAEYLALGKCVISTAVAGADEMIDDGNNGVLIKINDTVTLLDKILDLYENPSLCQEYSQKARTKYLQNYSEEMQSKLFSKNIKELII